MRQPSVFQLALKGRIDRPPLALLFSRQPGVHVWLMVVVKMVKQFAGREALIAQPQLVVLAARRPADRLDPHIVGQTLNHRHKLLKYLLRFIQDFAH